jgi:hypothetical protein
MTENELMQISRDFRKMIEAIPKTRVRAHMPTIVQISRLLGRLQNEIYHTQATLDAWSCEPLKAGRPVDIGDF